MAGDCDCVDCALFLHPAGICVFILSIVAKKSALNLTIRICSFVNMFIKNLLGRIIWIKSLKYLI